MGITHSAQHIFDNITSYVSGRKRKYQDENDVNKIIDIALHTPKRKKLLSTVEYIYQALFLEGKNSDVTVFALGQEFCLHKVYLCQSPYFASMFGGSWLETTQKYIRIDVVDPLINVQSLIVVLGSLYNSEISLNPLEIIPILATATMFQLDGLIQECTEVMLETINPKTALEYYNASCQYGDKTLQEKCFKWFLVNLMTYYFNHPMKELKTIPIFLMVKLVSHPDLFVVQTEYSIYVMLKYWIYLQVASNDSDPPMVNVNNYFFSKSDKVPYLLTEEGMQYFSVFQALRLQNLISHLSDLMLILQDNIIPKNFFDRIFMNQWKNVLRVNQNEDKGPTDISDEIFLSTSLRFGRIITADERHVWRWSGFHFGVDLVVIADRGSIAIKRNQKSDTEQLLSLQITRNVAIRMAVVKLNEQRQIVYSKQSSILKITLHKDEELQIMSVDPNIVYPIIICANIVYNSPDEVPANQMTKDGS